MKTDIKSLKVSELITGIHLIAVLFGLPLAVHHGYYDIDTTKYYYYCGTAVLLIPVLFFVLKEKPSLPDFFKTLSTAEKALLIYWIAAALSTLFSPYQFEAFWGNEGRLSGLMLMTVYVAAYFLISRCCKPHPIFIYACILSGSIVFLLGITDFFHLNLLHFKDNIYQGHISIFMSTIGNINFYTGYGAIIAGLTTALYAIWPSLLGAVSYFFLMVLSFVGLIIGNSDNAYLTLGILLAFLPLIMFRNRRGIRRYFMMVSALLFSFMIIKLAGIYFPNRVMTPEGLLDIIARWDGFLSICLALWTTTALIYLWDYRQKKSSTDLGAKAQVAWLLFLAVCIVILILILIDANLLGNAARYGNLRNYIEFDDNWGTHRGYIWRKAIENYLSFPFFQKLLGHGPDTYGIISYFRDLPESAGLYGELFDSVHNEYLQFLVTIGPIGTVAYVVFLALSIKDMALYFLDSNPMISESFIKFPRSRGRNRNKSDASNTPESPLSQPTIKDSKNFGLYVLGIVFAVACYCGQAVVSINQPSTTPIMWTLLALGIRMCRNKTIP